MILVKTWLSKLPWHLRLLRGLKGDDRNRIIGTFCSCAQRGFKNEITSVARHNEHKEVSCRRVKCAGEEGLFNLSVRIQTKWAFWTLPSFLACPVPSTATFKATSILASSSLLTDSVRASGTIRELYSAVQEPRLDHPLKRIAS